MGNYTNKLTEEELKALLKELPEDNKDKEELLSKSDNDILDFLTFYGLEAGSRLIPITLVYNLYTKWSKTPLTKNKFNTQICHFLAKDPKSAYFLINQDVLKINKYLYNFLKKISIKTKVKDNQPHFVNFINHYNIKKGSTWIEKEVFLYLYDLWTFNKKKSLSPIHLMALCKMYFPNKKTKDGKTLYGIDSTIFKSINKQQIKEIQEGVLFRHAKKKKGRKDK